MPTDRHQQIIDAFKCLGSQRAARFLAIALPLASLVACGSRSQLQVATDTRAAAQAASAMPDGRFTNDLQGITLTAWVSAADTVSVRFQNESGGALDLASGTIRVMARKPS